LIPTNGKGGSMKKAVLGCIALLIIITAGVARAETATDNQNHGGADWTPPHGATISGIHNNINVFTVAAGTTVFVEAGVALVISANEVNIAGTLNPDLSPLGLVRS